jgi:hypothetical protein
MEELTIREIEDVELANKLMLSQDYRQPIYDPHKSKYIFIPKKKK